MKNIMPRLTEGEQALLARARHTVHALGIRYHERKDLNRAKRRPTFKRLVRLEEARG